MQITWQTVVGTQAAKPQEIDTTSSPTTVYLRKNIKRVDVKMGEETIKAWQYEEAQLDQEQYEEFQKELDDLNSLANKQAEENSLILMEALAESYDQQATIQENQLIIMEAIADLYEKVEREEV